MIASASTFRTVPAPRRARSGFTIVEVLLALTILALLLSSMAVAFQASLRNTEENQRLASSTQTARSLLNRMTSLIRSAEAIDLNGPTTELRVLRPDDGSGDDRQVRYVFDSGEGVLRYRELLNGSVTEDQVLLGDTEDIQVSSFLVTIETGLDWQGMTAAKSVLINLTYSQDGRVHVLTVSACPRRNQTY